MDNLRIGIDLDNTIVCYDDLFVALAQRRGILQKGRQRGRIALRDELRAGGREDAWTELQGQAYGEQMQAAPPFAGALGFIEECVRRDVVVFIVSHRTREPYRGAVSDLHAAARRWLERQRFIGPAALQPEQVFLEVTRDAKMRRIESLCCTHFVDDLAEFLTDSAFPETTRPLLFDPHDAGGQSPLRRLRSWAQAWPVIFGAGAQR